MTRLFLRLFDDSRLNDCLIRVITRRPDTRRGARSAAGILHYGFEPLQSLIESATEKSARVNAIGGVSEGVSVKLSQSVPSSTVQSTVRLSYNNRPNNKVPVEPPPQPRPTTRDVMSVPNVILRMTSGAESTVVTGNREHNGGEPTSPAQREAERLARNFSEE